MGRSSRKPDLPRLRIPGWTAVDGLLLTIFAFMVCVIHVQLEPGIAVIRFPSTGIGIPDRSPEKNRLSISLRWNEATGRSTCYVKRCRMDSYELKSWMFPIARSMIEPATKYSKIPILIRAPGNMPFGEVERVFEVCRDRDIRIHKIALEVTGP